MFAPLSSSTAAARLRSPSQAACREVRPLLSSGSDQSTSPLWAMHHTILSTSPRAAA